MSLRKLGIGVWMGGRSLPIWCYDAVPEGVRPATLQDLWPGRPVLFQVRIGPDAGSWYQDYVRPTTIEPLRRRIQLGTSVYVLAKN